MDVIKFIVNLIKPFLGHKEEDVVSFSEATKQEDEIFFNKTVAQNEGFPNIVCPPTYLISIGMKITF